MRREAVAAGRGVMEIVLASASPRRQELLLALVDEFEALPSDVPEPLGEDPRADAIALAEAKARAVERLRPGALVIGSDTVVNDEVVSYGKPESASDAIAMLRSLRGRTHSVLTGVAVVFEGHADTDVSEARITLTNLTDEQVAAYVASGRPLDKAGAYAIQDEDVPTVSKRDGCYCCTMGLPLWRLKRMLEAHGVACHNPADTLPQCRDCPERD
ncbi:MAG: septum formation protein Maf [Anaerolinea sp.]|nr:septum formation protein Maf [Anaerolinea sp.]